MTSAVLLEQYLAERHALGFSLKTDEGCLRRFLRNYPEPDDGKIVFTKEFVMAQIETYMNRQTNTILRDVSAINGFLDFLIRKGFQAYKIPPKSVPKEIRNFKAYIFTDDEIERADNAHKLDTDAFCGCANFAHEQPDRNLRKNDVQNQNGNSKRISDRKTGFESGMNAIVLSGADVL